MNRSLWCLLTAALLLAGEAAAHDVWLFAESHDRPGSGSVRVEERVDVRLLVGHGDADPEPVARNDRLIADFSARGPASGLAGVAVEGGAEPVPGLHGTDPAGVFRPDRPGLWSVTYVGKPVEHRLDASDFESYLAEEGLDWVLEQRHAAGRSSEPGRELFSRSLQALVSVGGGAGLEGVGIAYEDPLGEWSLPVRFRLVTDEQDEQVVELQLLSGGQEVPGALVDLRRDGRLVTSLRTDHSGRLRLRPEAGRWVVTAVVMEASDDPRADWRTIFAALTFTW